MSIELKRAKKFRKMIKEKEIVDEKIKVITQLDKNNIGEKIIG